MINPQVSALNGSSTLKLTALTKKLKKEGKDVVNFTAGEPDFDTPDFIKKAAKAAIDEGFTKYTPSAGVLELREAIVGKFKEDNGLAYSPNDIIVTSGAKYAIYIAMLTALDQGSEVILPVPYWVSYPEIVRLCRGQVKFLPAREEDGFKINIKELEKAVTSKTRMLVMNYPANPTGVTYTREELLPIAQLAVKKNFYVLSDEIYEKLLYDGLNHVSFASLADAHKITLTVNGFSKSSAMTGWRLGYLAGPAEFIAQASKVADHTTSCACSISQKAGLAALTDKSWQEAMCKEFEKRRNLLFEGLSACGKKLVPLKPQGAFYMFCDIRKAGLKSDQFCAQLLEKRLVSCIPADSFGAEGYIRLSFATSIADIEKGVARIKSFLGEL